MMSKFVVLTHELLNILDEFGNFVKTFNKIGYEVTRRVTEILKSCIE